MTQELDTRCRDLIDALSLGAASDVYEITALTGGVASDIASLRVGEAHYCAKFALPKLKVAADWHAPVHRNAAEYAWLQVAAELVPHSAVRLFGRSEQAHGFVMEFVSGDDIYLLKTALLAGEMPKQEVSAIGDMVGRIQAASSQSDFDRTAFHNRDDFRALRIEPYLSYTAAAHPEVAEALNTLADELYSSTAVLVHGDVSPKNILIRAGSPLLLDAECATVGDASFDPSFFLNHLILKAIHLPQTRAALFAAVGTFWQAYSPHVCWEPLAGLEARICRLTAALMLARIDGKSPVEYLTETQRTQIREIALSRIKQPVATLAELLDAVDTHLKDLEA
ncbi:phosphotransferase [Pseudophaeobacter sp.]|uniref:phosphotransferase family protein n=1 Tax=Pseudophaeobacter sp. TaxID=1971739 RepID=UPI003299A0E3